MTPDRPTYDDLVLGYLDGTLSPEEQAALDAALRDDPEAARAVAQSALLLSTLRGSAVAGRLLDETQDAETGVPGSDAVWSQLIDDALAARQRHEVEAESERLLQQDRAQAERMRLLDRRRRAMDARAAEGTAAPLVIPKWIVLASAAAVALAVVLAVAGVFDPEPKQIARDTYDNNNTPARPDRGERPAVAFVAEVRSSIDARWGGTAHDRPTRLAAGNAVTLTQGLAEVVFDDGAAIIVQAPATFEPYGTNGMRLISGKLTADVPPSAVGFTVQTPGGLITDYGTSFGVIVNHDGQTLAHTFTGRIGLTPEGGGAEVALGAGDVAIADTRGRVRTVEHDALAFVRQEEFASIQRAADSPRDRWVARRYALERDEAVLVFVPFVRPGSDWPGAVGLSAMHGSEGHQSRPDKPIGPESYAPPINDRGDTGVADALAANGVDAYYLDLDTAPGGRLDRAGVLDRDGFIGRPGTTVYLSWRMQSDGTGYGAFDFAGLSLMCGDQRAEHEPIFFGNATHRADWSIHARHRGLPDDDDATIRPLLAHGSTIPLDADPHLWLVRIDFADGPDLVRIYLDPDLTRGTLPEPHLILGHHDVAFDRLRFMTGNAAKAWRLDEVMLTTDLGALMTGMLPGD